MGLPCWVVCSYCALGEPEGGRRLRLLDASSEAQESQGFVVLMERPVGGPTSRVPRSLFPHVEPFQRQDRRSCVVRREELFTLEELKRAGGKLKATTVLGIDGLPNEILKEVIGVYPGILLEVFSSCLREGMLHPSNFKILRLPLCKGNTPDTKESEEGII